ncbi:MAG: YlbF family regulator [Bacilli bacterium]
MTKLDALMDRLANALQDLPEVKQFFALREQILKDPFLNEQQVQMKHHQKLMMKHLSEQEIYQTHQSAYRQHQQAFDEHPLVQNYVTLKEQLSPLLNELQAIIE